MKHPLLNTVHTLVLIEDSCVGSSGYVLDTFKVLENSPMIADASTIAHDITEHLTPFDGTFENELCALGGAWHHAYFDPARLGGGVRSPQEVIAGGDLFNMFIDWVNCGARPLTPPAAASDLDCEDVEEIIEAFIMGAVDDMESELGDTYELDTHSHLAHFAQVAKLCMQYSYNVHREREDYPCQNYDIYLNVKNALEEANLKSCATEYLGEIYLHIDDEGLVTVDAESWLEEAMEE